MVLRNVPHAGVSPLEGKLPFRHYPCGQSGHPPRNIQGSNVEITHRALAQLMYNNIDSVRGYEGCGAALYFEALPKGFIEDWGFIRRDGGNNTHARSGPNEA